MAANEQANETGAAPQAEARGERVRAATRMGAAGLACLGMMALSGCIFGGHHKAASVDPELGGGVPVPQLGRNGEPNTKAEIGVNAFLWRASLETLSFLPLASVDPYGGVIIADWYVNPEYPTERFKVTVYILDTRLRADALRVQLAKQTKTPDGWSDVEPTRDAVVGLEDAILTRARQLRIATIETK